MHLCLGSGSCLLSAPLVLLACPAVVPGDVVNDASHEAAVGILAHHDGSVCHVVNLA